MPLLIFLFRLILGGIMFAHRFRNRTPSIPIFTSVDTADVQSRGIATGVQSFSSGNVMALESNNIAWGDAGRTLRNLLSAKHLHARSGKASDNASGPAKDHGFQRVIATLEGQPSAT